MPKQPSIGWHFSPSISGVYGSWSEDHERTSMEDSGDAVIIFDELETILAEVESLRNSRPILTQLQIPYLLTVISYLLLDIFFQRFHFSKANMASC